jgi:hypothetical protein
MPLLVAATITACDRAGVPDVDPAQPELFAHPEQRLTFEVPPELRVETESDGTRLDFHDRRTGEIVLHGELLPIYQHGLEPDSDPLVAHALWRARAWCGAQGTDLTEGCPGLQRMERITAGARNLPALRFEPVLTTEDLGAATRHEQVIGPFWAIQIDQPGESPHVLLLWPGRQAASPSQRAQMEAVVRTLRPPD